MSVKMRKKILIVNDCMDIGGNSVSLLSLLNAMDKDQYQIDLLLYKNKGVLLDKIPEGIRLLPQAASYQGRWGLLVRMFLLVISGYGFRAYFVNKRSRHKGLSQQILWDFQSDVLSRSLDSEYDCAISFFEGWADRYVAKKVHAKRKIGWLHSTFRKIAPIPELEQEWMDKMDHIVCVAHECKADFIADLPKYAHKATVIENVRDSRRIKKLSQVKEPADEDFERFKRADCKKIITVCRLAIETKGLDRALVCAAKMKNKGYKFLWCVVGDGNDREVLEKEIDNLGISDCFMLVGTRLNPYPFMRVSDVMCLPSRWEGKPLTVYESMILGVPPLVTAYLSAHEQISNEKEGIIVPNDDVSICSALMALLDEPKKMDQMKKYLLSQEYGDMTPVEKLYFLINE